MVSHKIYSRIVCLYCFLLIASQLTRAKTADDPGTVIFRQRMGVVLTTGADTPNDYSVLAPVIDLAVRDVKRDFNFEIEQYLSLYQDGCVEDSMAGLNKTVQALNNSVDFLLGPACTDDLIAASKLTTVYRVPLMTGAGSLVDSTDAWPYVTRTAYNTMTQWRFLLWIMNRFNWTYVVVFYEADNAINGRNGQSTYAATDHTVYR